MPIEMIEEETFNQGTRIKVIGVGGGGGNAVSHMINSSVPATKFSSAHSTRQRTSSSLGFKVPLAILRRTQGGSASRSEKGTLPVIISIMMHPREYTSLHL